MFSKTALYYDKIYSAKDYSAEVEKLIKFIPGEMTDKNAKLLDIACATGMHLHYLKQNFDVAGFDLDEELIQIARKKDPKIPFYIADMIDFNLTQQYEIIICLFSSIGYVKTLGNLKKTISRMAKHLKPNGILLVEPWFPPEMWKSNTVHAVLFDEPELKIARVNTSLTIGNLSRFDLHYLIGTPAGTEHFVERHELGLFSRKEMTAAFVAAGLQVQYDEAGLIGRGLYIGTKNC